MIHKRPRSFEDNYQRPSDDVLKAIGRIAATSAGIEDILHAIYWRFAEVPWSVAPIITGDQKPSRLAQDIIKMAVTYEEDEAIIQDLRDLFADYRELSEKRNKCVHWVWQSPHRKDGKRHYLNPPAHQQKKQPVAFTAKELERLADDLVWVQARMRTHALTEDEFEEERKSWGPYKHIGCPAPWLDKHRKHSRKKRKGP